MPTIEAQIYLALKSRIATLITDPTMPKFEPGATATPPVVGDIPQPFMLISDVRNDARRISIGPQVHVRSGTLMLSVQWPIAKPVDHVQLVQLAGSIAAHFPADIRMKYGSTCLRVTRDSDLIQPYRDDPYLVTVVRVHWSTM